MRSTIAAIILSMIVLLQPSAPQAYYVAPYGTTTNSGDPDAPKTLAWALQSAPQGSTVWMIPGVYSGDFRAKAPGVTYRSLPGTRAKIDGSLHIQASDVTWQGTEIYNSAWTNRTASNGSLFEVVNLGFGVPITGVQVIDNRIHDLATVADWSTSHASRWENNLVYNIGWTGHGHGLYTQNENPEKLFKQNIFGNSYSFAAQAYGSSAASLDNFTFENNVFLNGRFLLGGGRPVRNAHIQNNRFWKSNLQVGYTSAINQDVTITGNWLGLGRLQMQKVMTPTVTLNRIVADANATSVYMIPPVAGTIAPWNTNAYYRPPASSMPPFGIDGVGFYTLPQWRTQTGWDASSTFTATLPLDNWIEVTPAGAHHGRAVIYNWTNAPTVTLDLAPLGLTSGAQYQLVNAQNPSEVLPFTAGQPVVVMMTGWSVAAPYAASAPLVGWESRFGVWLVEPTP